MKTVMCDMDKVVRNWGPFESEAASLARSLGAPDRCLLDIALGSPLIEQVTVGDITFAQWRHLVHNRLTADHGREAADAIVEHWDSTSGALHEAVVGDLWRLRNDGLQLVLVTNATDKLDADLETLGLQDLFHHVCNSSQVGAAKPDVAFYEAALFMANAEPRDCWFIDDHVENVEAALAVGMNASVFDGTVSIRALLDESFLSA